MKWAVSTNYFLSPPTFSKFWSNQKISFFLEKKRTFDGDSFTFHDDKLLIIFDGVVLNFSEVINDNGFENLKDFIIDNFYRNHVFFNDFIGPFTGLIYDKETNKCQVFTNQTGDSFVFYSENFNDSSIFTNDYNFFIKSKSFRKFYKWNLNGAKQLLDFGYMVTDETLIQDIHRLMPGYFATLHPNYLLIEKYFDLKLNSNSISIKESVELVDKLFNKSISRIINTNYRLGYNDLLIDLSGGLDSRVINFAVKKIKSDGILNVSYAQSRSLDNLFASKVASELENDLIFYQLDYPSFMFDYKKVVRNNFGLAAYHGSTGSIRVLDYINLSFYGLQITGQLGDVIVGSYVQNYSQPNQNYKRLFNNFDISIDTSNYETNEEYILKTRGFQGILSTHLFRNNRIFNVSPFLDIHFLKAVMSIPLVYRKNHKLYLSWLNTKFPEAMKIKSTRDKWILLRLYNKLTKKFKCFFTASRYDMNPFEFWLKKVKTKTRLQNEYQQLLDHTKSEPIKRLIKKLDNNKSKVLFMHKLTLIAFVNLIENEINE